MDFMQKRKNITPSAISIKLVMLRPAYRQAGLIGASSSLWIPRSSRGMTTLRHFIAGVVTIEVTEYIRESKRTGRYDIFFSAFLTSLSVSSVVNALTGFRFLPARAALSIFKDCSRLSCLCPLKQGDNKPAPFCCRSLIRSLTLQHCRSFSGYQTCYYNKATGIYHLYQNAKKASGPHL